MKVERDELRRTVVELEAKLDVPKIVYQEEIVERPVVTVVCVEREVIVPQIHKRILQKVVERVEEEVIEVPKIECEEEIVERKHITAKVVPKYVEVPKIQESIMQRTVEQIQEVVQIQRQQRRVPVERIVEKVVEVPKIEYVEGIVERHIETHVHH